MHVQKHLQFVGRNEKLLLWCAQMAKCCGGWTNCCANVNSDVRNAPKQLRKTVISSGYYNLTSDPLAYLPMLPLIVFSYTSDVLSEPAVLSPMIYRVSWWERFNCICTHWQVATLFDIYTLISVYMITAGHVKETHRISPSKNILWNSGATTADDDVDGKDSNITSCVLV